MLFSTKNITRCSVMFLFLLNSPFTVFASPTQPDQAQKPTNFFAKGFNATWVSQTQAGTSDQLFSVLPGDELSVKFTFRNSGTETWTRGDHNAEVCFNMYKDKNRKTAPVSGYDQANNPLFGTSFWAGSSWPTNYRPACIEETSVVPGNTGTFVVNFTIPSSVPMGTFYEDISLASGPYWIRNTTNGDPLNVAHVWIGWKIKGATPLTSSPKIGPCSIFPSDDLWNIPVDTLPVHTKSAAWVNAIGADRYMHPDFGSGTWDGYPIGIPFNVVSASPAFFPIYFTAYGEESDPGPYPVPQNALREGGSDHHVLVVNTDTCMVYELYNANPTGFGWDADSGAVFDLSKTSHSQRPAGWTSSDAAGLPIFPGLARYDELATGIHHALRFTVPKTDRAYTAPASHFASGNHDANLPPMGARFRLKKSYDITRAPAQALPILEALQTYGAIIADNGSSWYFSGAPDERWDNDTTGIGYLKTIPGSAFEAVDMGEDIVFGY